MASTEDIIMLMEMKDISYLEAKKYLEDKEEAEAIKEWQAEVSVEDLLWS